MRPQDAAGPLFPLRRPVVRHRLPRPVQAPARRGLRVGLLGGSFNPAHDGHLHVSAEALKRLRLDQVWWLVSPQNPLKPVQGMAAFTERLAGARALARDPRIRVRDLEQRFGTRYTVDTLARLRCAFGYDFVWLIGADNLIQLPFWRHWARVMALAPVAVIDRGDYLYRALVGRAAVRFHRFRVDPARAGELARMAPPAWVYLRLRPHGASSTRIREAGGGEEAAATGGHGQEWTT
jgi:nicotinate-nucleotide adenylyltransferase